MELEHLISSYSYFHLPLNPLRKTISSKEFYGKLYFLLLAGSWSGRYSGSHGLLRRNENGLIKSRDWFGLLRWLCSLLGWWVIFPSCPNWVRSRAEIHTQFELIDSNELLACFVCGSAMNWDGELHEDDMHSHFSEGIDAILDASVFTTLGTILPWSVWFDPDSPIPVARLVGFGVLVILFRRLPAVLVLYKWIPQIRTLKEGFFVGWFGPMGVGAVYYALKAGMSLDLSSLLMVSGIVT